MGEKVDRRVRKTRSQLRAGLARLMQEKSIKEITVKELVEEVDINRSTFYLHYTDIYQMLECIEGELMDEITTAIQSLPADPINDGGSFSFITDMFYFLSENQDICNALLGPNGDMAFVAKIERLIAETILERLSDRFPKEIKDISYAYAFCLTGCVGMVKAWLSSEQQDTPEHMAKITYSLICNTVHNYIETLSQ